MPNASARLIAAVTVATLIACSSPPPTGTITSVTIDGGDRTIVLGDALTLTATVEVTGNASPTITWTSSDETTATIAPDGQVTSLTAGTTNLTATSSTDPTKNDTMALTINPPGEFRWTRQFGTSSSDIARGIATDANGNTYTTGHTDGDLGGPNAGGSDAFIRSYDSDGNHRWTHQFGTSSNELVFGVATDANGNTYTTGYTFGNLEGSSAGGSDAFIRSYDSDGNHRWTHQFGTSSNDLAFGIATDANGNVYATGYTLGALDGPNAGGSDAFIRSYDSDGIYRWTRQFGTNSNDYVLGIATDANGNVYTTGETSGELDGPNAGSSDAFIRSYDSDGNHRWTSQFGTSSSDLANGIATDANGNVTITGDSFGALEGPNAGGSDAFIRSYDSDGNHRWTHQFGTASDDHLSGIATDTNGNAYITGHTDGALEGPNAGGSDAFIRSYDSDGNHRWTRQFGTNTDDIARGIATDANGHATTVGYTTGALEGLNAGGWDAFIRSYGR